MDQILINFDIWGSFWEIFGIFFEFFCIIFGPPGGPLGPRRGPKMGPGAPGIDLKSPKKIQKFGPEVSTIFEILIFGFLGVFLMEINFFQFFPYFLPRGGGAPPAT